MVRRLASSLTPRGRGTTALGALLLVAGVGLHYPVLAGLGLCLLAVVVGDLTLVLRDASLQARRAIAPTVVVRNDACQGTLHLSSRRPGALSRVEAFELVDGVEVPVPVEASHAALAASLSYQVPTPRRGLMTVGPARLRRRGLAGMAATVDEAGGSDQVRVLPRRIALTGLPRGHRRALSGGDDSAEQGGTDLIGLHEYTMGDDLRRLHWATSARSGTLMVREDAEPAEAHVLVLLDDRVGSFGPGGELLFEEAVELAAALCRASIDTGGPVRFETASGAYQVVIPGSIANQPRREARELDWLLAEIQPALDPSVALIAPRDLDIAVVVTGPTAGRAELARLTHDASSRVIAVIDPSPAVSVSDEGGALVVSAATATELSAMWTQAVAR